MTDNVNSNLTVSERILEIRKEISVLQNKESELTAKEEEHLLKQESVLNKLVKLQEKRVKDALGTKQAELEISKKISSQLSDLSSISSIYSGLTTKQKESLKNSQSIISPVQESLLIEENKQEILNSTIDGVTELQSLQQKIAESEPEDLENQQFLNDSYQVKLNSLKEEIIVKKAIGELTEQEAEALIDVLNTQEQSLVSAQKYAKVSSDSKESAETEVGIYNKLNKAIGKSLDFVKSKYNSKKAILTAIVVILSKTVDKIADVNKELGNGFDILNKSSISAAILGFTFDNTVTTLSSLTSELGDISDATFSLQNKVNLMAENFGISNTEAVSLVGSFSRLNRGSTDVASNMVKTTQQFAKQNGIIPAQLMSDVAASTEQFALFGKEGGENILRAAGYAAKLGTNMSTLSGIAEGLLDFESSITKELELSAMLGRNINLNKARELAFAGKIEEATKATLEELGGIEEFNRMDMIQKKTTADLLGVSVGELQKMMQNQEKANALGDVMNEKFSSIGERISMLLNNNLSKAVLVIGGMVATVGAAILTFLKLRKSINKIKNLIYRILYGINKWVIRSKIFNKILSKVGKIFPRNPFKFVQRGLNRMVTSAKSFFASFRGGKGVIGGLKSGISSLGSKIKSVFKKPKTPLPTTEGMSSRFKRAKPSKSLFKKPKTPLPTISSDVSSKATPSISKSASSIQKGGMVDSVSKIDMNKVLKGAAALVIVAGAVFVFGKAVQEFMKVSWEAVGMAVVSMLALVGAVTLLGTIMSSGVGAVAILAGAGAMLVIAASVLVLGHALQAIGTGFEMLSSGIATLTPQLSSVTTVIGGLISLIPSISSLALSIGALSASLIGLGVAGLVSTPGLLALSTVGAISTGVGKLFGSDEEEVRAPSDNMNELITEIKGLRADLNSGKVAVYLDGKKVTASISREVDRSTTNSYAT